MGKVWNKGNYSGMFDNYSVKQALRSGEKKIYEFPGDYGSTYLFCPNLCMQCNYFDMEASNFPFKCHAGLSNCASHISKKEGFKQYEYCTSFEQYVPGVNTNSGTKEEQKTSNSSFDEKYKDTSKNKSTNGSFGASMNYKRQNPFFDSINNPSSSVKEMNINDSTKSRTIALILSIFGMHRFYCGKILTAVIQLILCFCFGLGLIWVLVDMIMIILGVFKDSDGRKLTDWSI